jgi:hypothetical protein
VASGDWRPALAGHVNADVYENGNGIRRPSVAATVLENTNKIKLLFFFQIFSQRLFIC